MKNFIGRLFGFRPPAPSGSAGAAGTTASRTTDDNPATIQAGSDNALRRQLVHVLMRDVLRRHGIPSALIECQMLVVASQSRGSGMYVRLVLKKWDERLTRYAFAFQNALMADILRFEPKASEWLYGISWQLEFDSAFPYAELPEKSFWQEPETAAVKIDPNGSQNQTAAAPTPTALAAAARQANADRRVAMAGTAATTDLLPLSATPAKAELTEEAQDLEQLFAIRDRELGRSSDDGKSPVKFENTQPLLL